MNKIQNLLIKQRNILLSIYLLSNIYFTFVFIKRGTLGGDFHDNYNANSEALLIGLVIILFSWFALAFLFKRFSAIKVTPINFQNNRLLDLFFLFLSLFYLYGCLQGYYLGNTGEDFIPRPFIFSAVNLFLHPDYLLIIYFFYRINSPSLTYLITLIFTAVSYFLAGRTGIFIFFLPLLNIYLILNRGKLYLLWNFLLIVCGLLIYPFIRFAKYILPSYYQSGESNFSAFYLMELMNGDIMGTYLKIFNASLERFQHVANISFIIDKQHELIVYFSNLDCYLIGGGFLGYVYNLIFDRDGSIYFNIALAKFIEETSFTWNVHSGAVSIFFISPLQFVITIFFMILILSLAVVLTKFFDSCKSVNELNWLAMLLFIFHGWHNAFILHFESLIIFAVILALFNTIYMKNKVNGCKNNR
jgi:hypothetical protein